MNDARRSHEDWIVPAWPVPPHVRALITTRGGGVSAAPYDTLNLGFSTGDDPAAVTENRRRLRTLLPQEPRWLKQVHGSRVLSAESVQGRPEADASVARERRTVCAALLMRMSSGPAAGSARVDSRRIRAAGSGSCGIGDRE